MQEKITCQRCQMTDFPVVKKKELTNCNGKQYHLEAYCSHCGRFIKNLKHTKEDI